MATRRITRYVIHEDEDYKQRFELAFRTLHAGLRALKGCGEGYTLKRVSQRFPKLAYEDSWFLNEKGKTIRRRNTAGRRYRRQEPRRLKRSRLKFFYQGKLYEPEWELIPF